MSNESLELLSRFDTLDVDEYQGWAHEAAEHLRALLAATPDQSEHPLQIPDECPHMIVFDDADREPIMFAGAGSRTAALKKWELISNSWNAHLFVRVARNSRDDSYPSASVAPNHEREAQPPPKVVLPERLSETPPYIGRADGWNACREEVAILNGIKP